MNLYDPDEHYQLANEVVDCLEHWPQLSPAQKERAVRIEVARHEFERAGTCFWPDTLPDGRRDMRGFDLDCRYRLLERHPATAGHAVQARAELATLVQRRRDGVKTDTLTS